MVDHFPFTNFKNLIYVLVVIRYIKDFSLSLALFSWVAMTLSEIVYKITLTCIDTHTALPVASSVLNRLLRYYKFVLIFQIVYCIIYHYALDRSEDICKNRFGFFFVQLIGEYDCNEPRNTYIIWGLDICIILLQLAYLNSCLSGFSTSLDFLKWDSFSSESLMLYTNSSYNNRYGSLLSN
ncbi:hypothetical protein TBLA_0J01960 [Henningerozyma blattae CBS 6284]|uniref:DUF1746 domain-containing protein n=1 Tax=Henningerozyma blattae (strain ATCC 34711 / CBS 6284 / DSM 70876 / NBRC 10599 / NRRL Y-10934 / UCD 77-7) TaxID=1071380 RepID=I2H9Y8_HENB6|nr:hypothetical protein TBLA_0J01960 [Tetrapisispora blattae CBS 6284]CCH63190.1 hypothetical protein TBLA_0J01960 [Tetrapisispora blattae CBS 6284]